VRLILTQILTHLLTNKKSQDKYFCLAGSKVNPYFIKKPQHFFFAWKNTVFIYA